MDEADLYEDTNTITAKDISELLEAHRKYFRWSEGERVLDIGCGPGDVTANIVLPFIPKDATLVGCDVSKAMIEACNKYKIDGRLTFKQLDIQQKKLENGWENESFNKIFSFYCLHWVSDYSQAFQNIYSLLKPDGELLFMLLTPDYGPHVVFEIMKRSPKWSGYIKDVKWFYKTNDPISFCEELLENVGFQEIECYKTINKHRIPSWNLYMELMITVNPYLPHIPTEMKSEFMKELGDLIIEKNYVEFDDVSEEITIVIPMIIASAKKIKRKKSTT